MWLKTSFEGFPDSWLAIGEIMEGNRQKVIDYFLPKGLRPIQLKRGTWTLEKVKRTLSEDEDVIDITQSIMAGKPVETIRAGTPKEIELS